MRNELEDIAEILDASENFRVLRRMALGSQFVKYQGGDCFTAIYLDLETTGLDPDVDEIIEIGMVPFSYNAQGQIYSVDEPFSMFREPNLPISPEITKINNITNDMVCGTSIDPNEIFRFAQQAGLIIAHNASFDRVFLEKFAPNFSDMSWACSMSQIAWKEEGFDGKRLPHIAAGFGFFYDAHRAVKDCYAGIEVLSRNLPVSGELAMANLLTAAQKDTQRIWAVGAPYDLKNVLKARGYRWNAGNDGRPKAWYFDVALEDYEKECEFLETKIYKRKINLPVTKITAKERFSTRA